MGLFRWDQGLKMDLDRCVQNAKNKCRNVWSGWTGSLRTAAGPDDGGRVQGHTGIDRLARGSRH